MTPPRKKFANELTHDNNDNEYSKRIRLISNNDRLYADGLTSTAHEYSRISGLQDTTRNQFVNYHVQQLQQYPPQVASQLSSQLLHPQLNSSSAFQPFVPNTTPNTNWSNQSAYRQQATADMYFFKNNENGSEFSPKKCRQFFKHYSSDSDSEAIGPDGIERLCADLMVKPEDVAILVLSWKLNAKVMGMYTFAEWQHGMTELKCDCVYKLRNKLTYLRGELHDANAFKSIYRYSFDFAKEIDQRCMDIEVAKQMLQLLLAPKWRVLPYFIDFLNNAKFKVINKDQYYNILDFSRTVNEELTNYDENSAWPVMLDEFVDWARKCRGFREPPEQELITVDE